MNQFTQMAGALKSPEEETRIRGLQLESFRVAGVDNIVSNPQRLRGVMLLRHMGRDQVFDGGAVFVRRRELPLAINTISERPPVTGPHGRDEADSAVYHVDQEARCASDGR